MLHRRGHHDPEDNDPIDAEEHRAAHDHHRAAHDHH
jgi:hypothetical protein